MVDSTVCKDALTRKLMMSAGYMSDIFPDLGRSVEWGPGSQFSQPILLQTKCTGFNNGIIHDVGKILFILYENSD